MLLYIGNSFPNLAAPHSLLVSKPTTLKLKSTIITPATCCIKPTAATGPKLCHFFRNTASETVRTLLVYGYVLDPPSSDQQNAEADEGADHATTSRTYRLEKNYAVGAGKW